MNLLLRKAAVQSAAARQLANSGRINVSGISALTGIPRAEVSRILNSRGYVTPGETQVRQNITSRVLSAWHRDPDYLTADRRARNLKIFGGGSTFESLVRAYGRGIPVRAILDELKRVGAIQIMTSTQEILPKMPLAIHSRLTRKKINDFDAATDVFLCLLSPCDIAYRTVSGTKVWSGPVPLVRRKIAPNAIALLRELQTKLARRAEYRSGIQKVVHASMKVVYSEMCREVAKNSPKGRRRNLNRNR